MQLSPAPVISPLFRCVKVNKELLENLDALAATDRIGYNCACEPFELAIGVRKYPVRVSGRGIDRREST